MGLIQELFGTNKLRFDLIGTFLALWLQQVSLKYSAAGVAQTLFATSPLFVIPIVALAGERVSLRALCGSLLAIVGVGFLFGLQ